MNNNDNFSIDSILSDLERMRNERGESDTSANDINDKSVSDAILEIDRLLGTDSVSLDGFSDYSELPEPQKAAASSVEPVVETNKHGQEMFGAVTKSDESDRIEDIFSDSRVSESTQDWTKIVDLVKNGGVDDSSEMEKTKIIGNTPPQPPQKAVADIDNSEMVDGQMILQGFVDEEILSQLDDAELEKTLSERSRENLKKFRLYRAADEYEPDIPPNGELFNDEEAPGEEDYNDDEERTSIKEYRHSDQSKNFIKAFSENKRSSFISLCGLLILEIAMITVSALGAKSASSSPAFYSGACLVLLTLSAALSISNLGAGFSALLKLRPNCHSASALLLTFTLIHTAVSFILPDSPGIFGIYCASAGFSLILSKVSELLKTIGVLENFKFCSVEHSNELYAVKSINDKSESRDIAKALPAGEPNVKYSHKIKFPSKFIENSDFTTSVDRLCKLTIPASFILSLISALIGWLKTKVALGALTAFTASLSVSMPAGAAFAIIFPTVIAMITLNQKGGMISSPSAASETACAHAVALDSFELFDTDKCGLVGFDDKNTVRIDEVLMYAAALIIGTKGPLSKAFEGIVGNTSILPPVKKLLYEEKLGVSGFIGENTVLLGNRNLLINHSIEAPPKNVEMKHLQQGKQVLYIAIRGKIAAMLILNYVEDENLAGPLKVLEKNGIHIIVNSVDCNVTEDFICKKFRLTPGIVKLMTPTTGTLFRSRKREETNSEDAKVLHTGTSESFVGAVATSAIINNIQRYALLAQSVFCALGWLISFIMILAGGLENAGWQFILIYNFIWTALSTGFGFWQTRSLN